jgi:hypothetical protein
MKHPANYKTQSGLIKALTRNSERAMDVSLAWWFKNAEYVLIDGDGRKRKPLDLSPLTFPVSQPIEPTRKN